MTRGLFYWLIKSLAWPMTHFYVRMSVEGDRAIPRAGACIVVANHRSYADPVLLGSAFPRRIHFLIARPVYRLYRMRWFYYMMGSIPVSRKAPDPGAMKRALRILRGGGVIGIFPEGQRVGAGEVGRVKAGVGLLAARSGATVIPAAIAGAQDVMRVGTIVPRPNPVTVRFAQPRRLPAQQQRRPSRAELNIFAEQVMEAIREQLQESGPAVDGMGDTVRNTKP